MVGFQGTAEKFFHYFIMSITSLYYYVSWGFENISRLPALGPCMRFQCPFQIQMLLTAAAVCWRGTPCLGSADQ